MSQDPQPDLRIGDTEREAGLRALGEHMSAGRLTVDEYGDRSARVATAVTRADLLALFTDLPEPRPRFTTPAPTFPAPPAPFPFASSPASLGQKLAPIVVPIVAIVGVILFFRFGLFPLLFLPLIAIIATRSGRNDWRRRQYRRGIGGRRR